MDGGRSHAQGKGEGQRARINCEEGQRAACLLLPEVAQEETEKVLKGNRFAILAATSEQVSAGECERCKSG